MLRLWYQLFFSVGNADAEQRHPFNSLFSRTTWVSRHQKG